VRVSPCVSSEAFVVGDRGYTSLFYIALIARLGGVVISFCNGNWKLPSTVLVLGMGLLIGAFTGYFGLYGLAGMAVLAAILWIANKADMS